MKDFWADEVKKAEREMRLAKAKIEDSRRGTPSGKSTEWSRKTKKPKGPAS